MKVAWFVALFSAICLEGLGRKYLPVIPSVVFYVLKDVVLVIGYFRFRPPPAVRKTQKYLYRGFDFVWVAGLGWTLLQMFNPEHQSFSLALLGIRAYWLWWIAPPIIAGVLMNPRHKLQAIYALIIMAVGIAVFAAIQFASPPDSAVNLYTVRDGQELYAADAIVASTGRARVASTFSFLSGFADFTVLIPTLLLSIGLEAKDRRLRRSALFGTLATAAVVPMAGSRGSILIAAMVLLLALWSAGLFFTRIGRRTLLGGIVAVLVSVFAFPDAMAGVQSRFANPEEVAGRFAEFANLLPPVALVALEYPLMGIGTGMMQNARMTMVGVYSKWEAEGEMSRLLIELGPIGFMLVWLAKLGLLIALLRAHKLLKNAGRRGAASAALAYAVLTMMGNLIFDHVYQALYFVGCGFILAEVASLTRAPAPQADPVSPEPSGPPPVDAPEPGVSAPV